jgi:hypothetical protein
MTRIVLVALLLAIPPVKAGDARSVQELVWMSGTWVHEGADGSCVTETWLGPRAGVMVATNLTSFPGGKTTYEFLRIAPSGESFSYFSSPNGRASVEFAMKELGDSRVVFEDPQRAFPRRILYWREGDALMARIEGTRGGQPLSDQWRFRKSGTDPASSCDYRRTPGDSSASPDARHAR